MWPQVCEQSLRTLQRLHPSTIKLTIPPQHLAVCSNRLDRPVLLEDQPQHACNAISARSEAHAEPTQRDCFPTVGVDERANGQTCDESNRRTSTCTNRSTQRTPFASAISPETSGYRANSRTGEEAHSHAREHVRPRTAVDLEAAHRGKSTFSGWLRAEHQCVLPLRLHLYWMPI